MSLFRASIASRGKLPSSVLSCHQHYTKLPSITSRHATTSSLSSQSEPSTAKPTVLKTVARATATGSYFVVVCAGIGLVGIVFWALGSNLFYETRYLSEAIDMVKSNPEVIRALGTNLKSYGERSTYGRRGGPVVSQRTEDGHVYMIFHVEGSTGLSGTCRLDVKEGSQGSEIRQLYCDIAGQPRIWLKQETVLQKKKKLFSWN